MFSLAGRLDGPFNALDGDLALVILTPSPTSGDVGLFLDSTGMKSAGRDRAPRLHIFRNPTHLLELVRSPAFELSELSTVFLDSTGMSPASRD